MAPSEIQAAVVHRHLQRVLGSPGFAHNERMSRFLRFIVEQQLSGRESELKESLIGIEVFGRKPGFDPQQDSTVRSEAARLRARLAEYYAGDGRGDSLVIELPKGGYTPRFRQLETAGETAPQASDDERKTPPRRLWLMVALAGLAVATAAGSWWRFQHPPALIAIAVLPLSNLSRDPAGDYFADGLTSEIIRNLSIIDGLAVRSQTSSFAFKGKQQNIRDAGKQLDAEYILEGSIFRSGQQLRINARLVRVRDDFPLWSAGYDEELTDVFAIQDKISRGIVNNLRLNLGRGRRRYETSVEAYDLYLRARALQSRGLRGDPQTIGAFEEAIAKDPSFTPAYAGLAGAIVFRSGASKRYPTRDDELSSLRATAEKAIQLDPLLAEAHDALGMSYARDGQWEQSEKSFRHAIELDPSSSTSYSDLAIDLLLPLGRLEEGLHELRVAEKADPLSSEVHLHLAVTLLAAGRYDEAASQCEKMSSDHQDKSECLGRAKMDQGRIGEAIPILAVSPAHNWGYLAYAYARAGRRAEAEKLMTEAPALYPDRRGPFQFALAFAGLGDKDHTIDQLERLADLGPVRLGRELICPEFALVRNDSRVKVLRKKIGLPE
jgi:TolB-like protein/Flp pilus assembly protein TadD